MTTIQPNKKFDPSAIVSDTPRSRWQYLARTASGFLVNLMGINRGGYLATEFAQAVAPVSKIETSHGTLLCRGGHGRLRWRAQTFHTEEPDTVSWLDTLLPEDVLWDVGANVGLYSLYASKFKHCQVFSFEPEAQNFALLVENVALNEVGDRCFPACLAISETPGIGRLKNRVITKGGSHNFFYSSDQEFSEIEGRLPESARGKGHVVEQVVYGVSLNELMNQKDIALPTHLKVDVDGLEPEIIGGSHNLLKNESLRTILIEINSLVERHAQIPDVLNSFGFQLKSQRSNWESRENREREEEMPATNMIFYRS